MRFSPEVISSFEQIRLTTNVGLGVPVGCGEGRRNGKVRVVEDDDVLQLTHSREGTSTDIASSPLFTFRITRFPRRGLEYSATGSCETSLRKWREKQPLVLITNNRIDCSFGDIEWKGRI